MTTKPLCVLLDDEELALEALKEKIEELDTLEIEKSFLDPDELLDNIDFLKSQIFFLDIEMGTTGIKIAKELKNKSIIFVSGHNEYISDVVEINPIAFVQKPIKKHKLKKAIEKALIHKNNASKFIVLKTQNSKKEELKQDEIVYIQTVGRIDKEIFLSNGQSRIAKNINWDFFLSQLSVNFLQISPQNIVNLDYATKLISADLIGINCDGKTVELTLGNKYKESFFEAKPHLKN